MTEQNFNRAEAMLAHLKARGATVMFSGDQFRLQTPGGSPHDNDVAALRAMLQALGLMTAGDSTTLTVTSSAAEGATTAADRLNTPADPAAGHWLQPTLALPALVDPQSPAKGSTLALPLVARDVEVLRHKAGAWFSSTLGIGATLFAILLSRYQQKEDWLRELGVAIGQQAGPGEAPRAWFLLAPLLRRLPVDGSLREGVTAIAEHLLDAAVSAGDTLDLALVLPDSHDEDQLLWHYAGDLFDEAFIRQLHADFVAVMRQATALITPHLSAISLYGTGVSRAAVPVAPAMAEPLSDEAPVRDSALWRTVQAVIDGHVASQGVASPPPAVVTDMQRYPLSPQQWLLALDEQQSGAGARHSITVACLVTGSEGGADTPRSTGVVDLDKAQKALAQLMKRHTILRTGFEWHDQSAQMQAAVPEGPVGACQYVQAAPALPWRALVLSTTESLQSAAAQWLRDAASQPLSMFSGLPWQASVATVSNGLESASVWRLTLHNAVADRASADRLLAEWQQFYNGEAVESEVPVITYGDYSRQQITCLRSVLSSGVSDLAETVSPMETVVTAYWREQLQVAREVSWPLLATDKAATAAGGSALADSRDLVTGAVHGFTLDAELMQRVRVAAVSWQVTPESILLTAFATLIRRYVGQDRFVIGVEFDNRRECSIVGAVSNVLPFVAHLDDLKPGVRHRVEHVHGQLSDMAHYQNTTLLSLLPQMAALRGSATEPPLNFVFGCQEELSVAARQLLARGVRPLSVGRSQPRVALGLSVRCSELQASQAELEYFSNWLNDDGAADFVEHYLHLLTAMVADANASLPQLPLMSLTRQQEMFDLFNREAQSLPSFLPHFMMWWQRQCYSAPQNLAVVAAEGRMNFAELNAMANQIARYLVLQEITAGDRLGLLLPRDPVMLATVLAIFKVGAAWVPLHPQWPLDYQQAVLTQANAVCVLHDSERLPWQGELKSLDFSIAATPWHALDSDAFEDADDPSALACILFPAAITSQPQGIAVSHRNLSALVAWGVRLFEHRPPLRAAFTRELLAESALFEVFVTLCSGGAVVLIDDLLAPAARERPTSSAAKLLGVVNHLTITPTLAAEMLRDGLMPKGLRSIALVGEPVPATLRDALLALPGLGDVLVLQLCAENSGVAFVATYGEHARPARWRTSTASDTGVGSPIDGTQCVILNAQGQLQPWGIAGDLYIGGAALCSSLIPPATAGGRFIKNPLTFFPTLGTTLLHTGYRACWHADGRIELLALVQDTGVATRGLVDRLRAEQCMQVLLGDVQSAMVSVKSVVTGRYTRVAFVRGDLPARHYLQRLQRDMPARLCPEQVCVVGLWPRTGDDVLDRAALALQYVEGPLPQGETAATTLELQMLRLWQEVMGEQVVSIDTDFSTAGGHSLLALQLAVQLAQRYALHRVPAFTTLLQYPTPRRMARWLDAALRGEESRAALWEPLNERVAERSLLCFEALPPESPSAAAQTPPPDVESGAQVAWSQVAQALPDSCAAYRVRAQLRHDDEPATLVQRYVDAIEQESLPLPAALVGEGAGAALAAAVACEMQARGWPWLPLVLVNGVAPVGDQPVLSRVLHVNGEHCGIKAREPWVNLLQGEVQWRIDPALAHNANAQMADWVNGFMSQVVG